MTTFPVIGSIRMVSHMINSSCSVTVKTTKELRGPFGACENIVPPVSSVTPPAISSTNCKLEMQMRLNAMQVDKTCKN